jgi:inner membrane protein involved in colicin E2 resistance
VPADVESPTSRHPGDAGTTHVWTFPNVTGVEAAGLAVPDFVDAAKVASRMSFFGPLSLGLFFLVLVIAALRMQIWLHLMHFVLLAAACFSFQLLFAYSVDVMPALVAFGVAAMVSMALVAVYLKLVAGTSFMRLAVAAQAAYIVLFNATFFFEGYTGLTLTIMGIVTLGLIMTGTATMDWNSVLGLGRNNDSEPEATMPHTVLPVARQTV